jgi:hypothetical protein
MLWSPVLNTLAAVPIEEACAPAMTAPSATTATIAVGKIRVMVVLIGSRELRASTGCYPLCRVRLLH